MALLFFAICVSLAVAPAVDTSVCSSLLQHTKHLGTLLPAGTSDAAQGMATVSCSHVLSQSLQHSNAELLGACEAIFPNSRDLCLLAETELDKGERSAAAVAAACQKLEAAWGLFAEKTRTLLLERSSRQRSSLKRNDTDSSNSGNSSNSNSSKSSGNSRDNSSTGDDAVNGSLNDKADTASYWVDLSAEKSAVWDHLLLGKKGYDSAAKEPLPNRTNRTSNGTVNTTSNLDFEDAVPASASNGTTNKSDTTSTQTDTTNESDAADASST
eukprot:TRINITY_DN4570_c2_g1_i1.p1 TRINITY_DN4570_c2_g1~~TRINITY_DN4570_c2_g1_i1.p1  ORF type:complete len:270 (-),score=67.16 TRINITY_DN4570_c2_g1_i1:23-832(-)